MRITNRLSHALLGFAVATGALTAGAGVAQAAPVTTAATQTQSPVTEAPAVLGSAAYLARCASASRPTCAGRSPASPRR
jgi:hypothetical protein